VKIFHCVAYHFGFDEVTIFAAVIDQTCMTQMFLADCDEFIIGVRFIIIGWTSAALRLAAAAAKLQLQIISEYFHRVVYCDGIRKRRRGPSAPHSFINLSFIHSRLIGLHITHTYMDRSQGIFRLAPFSGQ
jgi:hypothetical protein